MGQAGELDLFLPEQKVTPAETWNTPTSFTLLLSTLPRSRQSKLSGSKLKIHVLHVISSNSSGVIFPFYLISNRGLFSAPAPTLCPTVIARDIYCRSSDSPSCEVSWQMPRNFALICSVLLVRWSDQNPIKILSDEITTLTRDKEIINGFKCPNVSYNCQVGVRQSFCNNFEIEKYLQL